MMSSRLKLQPLIAAIHGTLTSTQHAKTKTRISVSCGCARRVVLCRCALGVAASCEPAPGGGVRGGRDPPRGARPRSGLPLRTRFSVLLGKLFVHES